MEPCVLSSNSDVVADLWWAFERSRGTEGMSNVGVVRASVRSFGSCNSSSTGNF